MRGVVEERGVPQVVVSFFEMFLEWSSRPHFKGVAGFEDFPTSTVSFAIFIDIPVFFDTLYQNPNLPSNHIWWKHRSSAPQKKKPTLRLSPSLSD